MFRDEAVGSHSGLSVYVELTSWHVAYELKQVAFSLTFEASETVRQQKKMYMYLLKKYNNHVVLTSQANHLLIVTLLQA